MKNNVAVIVVALLYIVIHTIYYMIIFTLKFAENLVIPGVGGCPPSPEERVSYILFHYVYSVVFIVLL